MITVPITLREEDQRFIEEAVKSGSFLTTSEVVAIALDLLKTREEFRKARRAELQREIQKGIDEVACGKVVEFDSKSFLAEMHARHAQ